MLWADVVQAHAVRITAMQSGGLIVARSKRFASPAGDDMESTVLLYTIFGLPFLIGLGEAVIKRRGFLASIANVACAIVGGIAMMFAVVNLLGTADSEIVAGLKIYGSLIAGAVLMLMLVNKTR